MSNVVPLFVKPIADRAADRVIPPTRQPGSLADFGDAAQLQVQRDRQLNSIGTWLAVGGGVLAFFLVRDWRHKRRKTG